MELQAWENIAAVRFVISILCFTIPGMIRAVFYLREGSTMRVSFRMLQAARVESATMEFENGRERFSILPERELMVAILDDAIACYMSHMKAKSISGKTLFHEAENWFFTERGDWIFSFPNICHTVGLDPNYVRQGLLGAKKRAYSRGRAAKIYHLDGGGKPSASSHREVRLQRSL